MKKTPLLAILSVLALLFAGLVPASASTSVGSSESVPGNAADFPSPYDKVDEDAGGHAPAWIYAVGFNHFMSTHNAVFAEERNGQGYKKTAKPGYLAFDIKSAWAPSGCTLITNGWYYRGPRWVNKLPWQASWSVMIRC